jgi:hypothetical protein
VAKVQVLRDLHIKMMIMVKSSNYKFINPKEAPNIKFKIASDEIKLVFNPTTYVHLVNIS